MRVKKIPLRKCLVSGERLEKKDLIRIVRTPENEILIDKTGKLNGKGAYLSKSVDIINKAKKTKVLDRVFERTIDDSIYEDLLNNI